MQDLRLQIDESYRVAVIHGSPLTVQGLEHVLHTHPGLEHAGSAASAAEVNDLVDRHEPHVALVEYEQACRFTGWAAALRGLPTVRVLLYGRSMDTQAVLNSLHLGAVGFVHHSVPVADLMRGLVDVVNGRTFLYLGEAAAPTKPPETHVVNGGLGMTSRERQVLGMLLLRHSNDEIAERLTITHQTAKNYVSRVFRKVGVSSRRELLSRGAPAGSLASVVATGPGAAITRSPPFPATSA